MNQKLKLLQDAIPLVPPNPHTPSPGVAYRIWARIPGTKVSVLIAQEVRK